jgi:pimeloyl-ACP methyl ester carboxylesterase
VTPTIVLIHGAGDAARVWDRTRALLSFPSVAVDLLGRASRPFDLTRVTLEEAARVAAHDVRADGDGPWVVVAHSAGALVAPQVVAHLGAGVRHLVMIAGVTAPEGHVAIDVVHPERRAQFEQRRGALFAQHRGHTFVSRHAPSDVLGEAPGEGLVALADARVVQAIDSLRSLFQPVSWAGVAPDLPRTWVRCTRDSIQSPEMQQRLIAASGATAVRDIDTDHTPARDDPAALAALLDDIARSTTTPPTTTPSR